MFAVLHLPDFALQAAARHEPDLTARPVALLNSGPTTPRVFQRTAAARDGGVEVGQTAVQAMARCREVILRRRSPKQEAAATEAVVQVAFSFTPYVEVTGPGIFTLDLRGLAELRGERSDAPASTAVLAAWARRLQAAVSGLGLQARIGTGPTPNVARHAARWSDGIELVADAPTFISSLPVAALDPSSHVADILRQWGLHTVGEVLALGQAELAERFGLEAFALFAAASPGAVRPLNLVRPVERFEESFEFDPPVETLEPLLFLLRRFIDQIGHRLEACGWVAESLHLTLRLESGAVLERRLRVPQPTRVAEALMGMLQTHLESLRTDAPILGIALTADPTRPEQKQFSLFEAALRDPHQFQETLARLSALVGADRVGTPHRENTHRPDAFKLLPPDFENAPAVGASGVAELYRSTPWRRLRPAPRTQVEFSDGLEVRPEEASQNLVPFPGSHAVPSASPKESPASTAASTPRPLVLRGSTAGGRITVALGPWRSSGDWWDAASWQREEWDVETQQHQVVRLVRQKGEWTVEAIAD